MPHPFDNLYDQLSNYIDELEITFLSRFLADPLAAPQDYDLYVKSYCLLSHAAIEDFIESIVKDVMHKSIDNYIKSSQINIALVTLLHLKSKASIDFSSADIVTIYDYLRSKMEELKTTFSKEIYGNHGISLKYIKNLLYSVGINIDKDPLLQNSLKKLSSERGAYAHLFLDNGRIKRSLAPEESKEIVSDCLMLCIDILEQGKQLV